MKVQLIDSVSAFLEMTAERRAADPLRMNVIGSVAQTVSSRRGHYDDFRWWVVTDDDVVVALAMREPPLAMVLAPSPSNAAALLGDVVSQLDDDVPGVSGPRDVVASFLEGYHASGSPGSQRAAREVRVDHLYELDALTTPKVEGHGRRAHVDELDSLSTMFVEFMDEAGLHELSLADARESVARDTNGGSLFCWEHQGELVSFARHAPVVRAGTSVVGRIGPVFTPPRFRRHGYASALTAMVSQHLLDQGARVMLFTDAANSTSNAIYQALGYRLIDELVDVHFEER